MKNWVTLNEIAIDKSHHHTDPNDGVVIEVSMSPYDIPKAVAGYKTENQEWFIIEFKYISEEPVDVKTETKNIKLFVGKNSDRIYQIHINLKEFNASSVTLKVKEESLKAIESHKDKHPSLKNSFRGKVTRSIIEENETELFKLTR